MSTTRLWSILLVLGLAGCDGTATPMDGGTTDASTTDSGPPDVGPRDAGPPLACTDLTPIDGVFGDTVSVMFDTRMTETRPRDLGLACGNPEGELRWAPQEVVALTVPGTGPVAVELDTVFDGTDIEFNTVLQVRRTCEQVPEGVFPPTCFDDASAGEFRSRGGFTAMGGETVFIIVTGYSNPPPEQDTVDEGRVRLDITVRDNAAPTVTAGGVLLALDDTYITATGNDADADVRGVAINFYDARGLLDIYGDGAATEDGDVFTVFFDPAPTDADYTGNAVVRAAQVNLAPYLRGVRATRAAFRVFDAAWAVSAPFMVDITEATLVGFGEACDTMNVCRPELTCMAGVCGASGPVATTCGGAGDLGVSADGVPVTVMGTTGAGAGNFAPSCVNAMAGIGAEAVYKVAVPPDTVADLIVTTDVPGTGTTDTILYVRRECADSGTELGCNDDRAMGDVQSDVTVMNLASGEYYVFVERFNGLASGTIPHAIRATLRPVLAAGAPCDMTGMTNRCAAGTCTAGVCP